MKILNFGSCNIDYVYSVRHITKAAETNTAEKLEIFPGGKGLNQSIAAAKAGVKIYHAGCVGSDGDMLRKTLTDSMVDISYLKKADIKNGHAVIQVDKNGENSIFIYKGSNAMITADYIDKVLADFSAGDILLLQNEINNVDYIVEKAYKIGMKIYFNPSPFNEKIRDINPKHISCFVLNEVEAAELCGMENVEGFIEYMKKTYPEIEVMLTLGKQGCVYSYKDTKIYQPAFLVDAVDTTAAGDTFTGYFIAGIIQGKPMKEILRTASAASAISVSRPGASSSIPLIDEVEKCMEKMKVRTPAKEEKQRKFIESYIDGNISECSLGELAKAMNYSKSYTGSLIKSLTGDSFSKLLQKKRCSLAAKLLVETDLCIEEIIRKIGYENESFFRNIFKKTYGLSPKEYRKEHEIKNG